MQASYWSRLLGQPIGRRRAVALGAGSTVGAAFLVACGSGGGQSTVKTNKSSLAAEPVDTMKEAKRGGVMKARAFADPPTLDVLTPNNPATPFCHDVYSGLVQFKPGYFKPSENAVSPVLA